MSAMINIGSKQSKKNLKKLAVFINSVFKSANKYKRSAGEVSVALGLGVKAFSSDGAIISGCTLNAAPEKVKKGKP